jgi:uncharacterized RDD family membrane protein YckC
MEYEDRVRISTPEGVDVELTLAGIGSRFIAAILDFMIQVAVVIAVAVLLGLFSGDRDGGYVAAVFSLVFFLTFFAYDVLFEVRSRGRTPGKRWTGLRVVRTGGRPVTFVRSCVRNVLRLVDILPSFYAIGMVSIFVTRNNQRLGDLAAGTYIVRERAGGFRRSREPVSRVATTAGASWDVSAVSAKDTGTVRQFLDRRDQLSDGARQKLAEELERRLRPVVGGASGGLRP